MAYLLNDCGLRFAFIRHTVLDANGCLPQTRLRSGRFAPDVHLPSPPRLQGCPGKIHYVTVHARPERRKPFLSGCRDSERPSMRYVDSIFGSLLKPIDRRRFQAIVDRHDGDAYDKSFKSWDSLGGADLRAVGPRWEPAWARAGASNANAHHHYHLNVGKLAAFDPVGCECSPSSRAFAQTFAMLAKVADRRTRREGAEMVRLIDASPIPLGKMCKWAKWNGRIQGHENARRLSSPCRLPTSTSRSLLPTSTMSKSAAKWRSRAARPTSSTRLLSLRMVEEDQ